MAAGFFCDLGLTDSDMRQAIEDADHIMSFIALRLEFKTDEILKYNPQVCHEMT